MVSILLKLFRAGESVASLSSETTPQAEPKFFLDDKVLIKKSVQFGMILVSYEG